MNEVLSKLLLAAKNNDGKDWISSLPIILLAIFWIVGGILKARANKKAEESEHPDRTGDDTRTAGQSAPHPPARSPLPQPRKYQPAPQPQARPTEPSPKIPKPRMPQQQPLPAETIVQPRLPQFEAVVPALTAELAELPKFTSPQPQLIKPMRKIGSPDVESIRAAQIELELQDVQDLRKAVLYAEIIGKPLSLRELKQF